MSNLETGAGPSLLRNVESLWGGVTWTWQGCLLPHCLWDVWALPASPGLKV